MRRRHERRTRRRALLRRLSLAGLGTIVAVLVFPAIQRFGYAYREGRLVDARLETLRERHERLTATVAERRRYRDYLRTAESQEARARHDGFHREGEHVYLLPPENP